MVRKSARQNKVVTRYPAIVKFYRIDVDSEPPAVLKLVVLSGLYLTDERPRVL